LLHQLFYYPTQDFPHNHFLPTRPSSPTLTNLLQPISHSIRPAIPHHNKCISQPIPDVSPFVHSLKCSSNSTRPRPSSSVGRFLTPQSNHPLLQFSLHFGCSLLHKTLSSAIGSSMENGLGSL
jgi:hypothetical protein